MSGLRRRRLIAAVLMFVASIATAADAGPFGVEPRPAVDGMPRAMRHGLAATSGNASVREAAAIEERSTIDDLRGGGASPAPEKGEHLLRAPVLRIIDGDTFIVRDAQQREQRIRLAGVDAPELKQTFGGPSRDALAAKLADRTVRVSWRSQDHGRLLGRVEVDGRSINREMVAEGWAWHDRRFDQSAGLTAAQQKARDAKAGLWRDEAPIAPWDYRAAKTKPAKAPAAESPPADPR